MSPWSNYTFRVIARNKVGESLPSSHSKTCLTPEDVPYKNPDNVEGRGTAPNNLVIYWTVSLGSNMNNQGQFLSLDGSQVSVVFLCRHKGEKRVVI
jgi:hypothetical protein